MGDLKEFGSIASSLARGPLGIIALFIVLVYGFAALVTGFGAQLDFFERIPLVYFMVLFPVAVLASFTWLVACHHTKLYPPDQFRDEKIFLELHRQQLTAVASLAAASARTENPTGGTAAAEAAVEAVAKVALAPQKANSDRKKVLWVDDRPQNNLYTRRALEAVGVDVTLAETTSEALDRLRAQTFGTIISDMGRREGPNEGYVLLDEIRKRGITTPYFIHAGSSSPEHDRIARERGAQGNTDDPNQLFIWVMEALAS